MLAGKIARRLFGATIWQRGSRLKFVCILLICLFLLGANVKYSETYTPVNSWPEGVQWLLGQQTPFGLVRSLLVDSGDSDYDKSWIYDNALAVIAWSLEGQCQPAAASLAAMAGVVDSEGKLSFAYFASNGAVSDGRYRTGSIAWVGYAYAVYEQQCGDSQFRATTEKIANWVLSMQVATINSVRGGPDVDWFATEHAIDAFYLFDTLYQLTNNSGYQETANQIKVALLNYHWNDSYGCFHQGIWDTVNSLDSASWGVIFLTSIGETEKAEGCLNYIEANFRTTATCNINATPQNITGYKPYIGTIEGTNWTETEVVWAEGSLGVALAFRRAGNENKYNEIINEISKMQGSNGGIVYACPEVPDFRQEESVAGTAWMAVVRSDQETSFWGIANPEPPEPKSSRHTQINIPGPANTTINSWNGNLFYPLTLLSIPGRGLSIELTLNYNSSWRDTNTSYGFGWKMSYDMQYSRDTAGNITIIWGDGSSDRYINTEEGFQPPVGVYDTLLEYAPTKYLLTTKQGTIFYFDSLIHKRISRIQPRIRTLKIE